MIEIRYEATSKEPVPQAALHHVGKLLMTKKVFGVPAASLTWGINGSASSDVSAGAEGEKQVAKLLSEFASSRDDIRAFNSIRWPGSNGDTDHMIVCGNRVICIDAKRWKSQRKYSVTPKGTILRGTVPFPEGKVKILPALNAWRGVLPKEAKVTGVICIAQEKVFVPYDKNYYKAPFRLVTAEHLIEMLDKQLKPASHFDPAIVFPIITNLIKPQDRRARLINPAATQR